MNTVAVELTGTEVMLATYVGSSRQWHARRHDLQGGAPAGLVADIGGALAEIAVAKHLNVYWQAVVGRNGGDVDRYEVRHTEHTNGCLILHPADHDDKPYILVRGKSPLLELAGWLHGEQGKQERYWQTRTGRPCYMVPVSDLRDMGELT